MTSSTETIVYVTRDIERALGIEPNERYFIVTNKTPFGEEFKNKYPEFVLLVDAGTELLGTTDLLGRPETKELMDRLTKSQGKSPSVLVFKNTLRVETVIKANNWKCLNPRSQLAERVENKITQLRWLGESGSRFLPPHVSKQAKFITWKNDPFVLQWAHGHTGDGTILIRTREDLLAVQEKFPERMARISTYIAGPSYTVNAIVAKDKILMGNVSYQITGAQPFTDNEFSTIGNDWSYAHKSLSADNMKAIQTIVNEIGQKLHADGWRGLFGVDVIRDDVSKRMFLIEVNARQPASTTYESQIQTELRAKGAKGLSTFEAHVRAMLEEPIQEELIAVTEGSQVVQRVTKNIQGVFDDVVQMLEKMGNDVLAYQNTAYNSDLLRIQSREGIMDNHKDFNSRGKEILNAIKGSQIKLGV